MLGCGPRERRGRSCGAQWEAPARRFARLVVWWRVVILKVSREAFFLKLWRDMVWVRQCVKLLGDSGFQGLFVLYSNLQGLFVRQAIGRF